MNRITALISVLCSFGCLVGLIHWIGLNGKSALFFGFLMIFFLVMAYEIMAHAILNRDKRECK